MYQRIKRMRDGKRESTEYIGVGDTFRIQTYPASPLVQYGTKKPRRFITRSQAAAFLREIRKAFAKIRDGNLRRG